MFLPGCKTYDNLIFKVVAYSPSEGYDTYYLKSGCKRIVFNDSTNAHQLDDSFKLEKIIK